MCTLKAAIEKIPNLFNILGAQILFLPTVIQGSILRPPLVLRHVKRDSTLEEH